MNMGYLLHPPGDPRIAGFENNTDRVNAVADRSRGFVWRLKGEDLDLPRNDAGRLFGRPDVALATLSVWESFEDFERFVHNTVHGRFLARRAEWFEPMDVASHVIWPVKAGHVPDLIEGKEKLVSLRENGPTDAAYDFKYKNSRPSGSVA
ncbi:MAG: DUF3291 domain-containing protein [Rhodobacteraceae bacterium]|nr:DUF3291 domain-containing protein [Paracoccaceae bacterium]